MHTSTRALSLIALVSASVWGLYWWPLREIEAHGVEGLWAVALFNACPLIILLPSVLWRRNWSSFKPHLLFSALATGLALSTYAGALTMSSVVRVTMLFYLTPIWSTIIGWLWLQEPLSAARIVAIVLGLAGLLLLLGGNDTSSPLNVGDILALLSGLLWGLGTACIKRWPQMPTTELVFSDFVIASGFTVALALLIGEPATTGLEVFNAIPVAAICAIAVLLPSMFALAWVSQRLFPGRMGILMMSEVFVAVASATILLPDEQMLPLQWLGAGFIIAACFAEITPMTMRSKNSGAS